MEEMVEEDKRTKDIGTSMGLGFKKMTVSRVDEVY
jgi:hypothetical protein